MSSIVVDTSAVLAMFDESYSEHSRLAELLMAADGALIVSPMVLAESDYMLSQRLGADAARRFALDVVTGAYELAEWSPEDLASALRIVDGFSRGKDYVGITDAANVVLADRYRTTTIATLDQRHFRCLRPLWGADHFTLLPYDAP